MIRATSSARSGRLPLVALIVALAASLAVAVAPPRGSAADESPGSSPAIGADGSLEPSPSVEPAPFVDPSPSVDPSPTQEVSPPPPPPPTVVPTPNPTPAPTSAPTAPPTPTPTPGLVFPATFPQHCHTWTSPVSRADLLLTNRYRLGSHPTVTLGSNPTWREDPLNNANWRFLHHSLGAVQNLLEAYHLTHDTRYRDRAVFLMKDWLADNPRSAPPSTFSWNDHSTALRANMFACATYYLPREAWLTRALQLHGATLADPSFYVYQGNHALDQSMGLLEVGGVLGRYDWMGLARDRMGTLLAASVDTQGVTNEQSVSYQNYNRHRYTLAEQRLRAWRLYVPAVFSRIPHMPGFLAHATRPDGRYEMIGDTENGYAAVIPGTIAEYAASRGLSGPRPTTTLAAYRAGFMFSRTGWGSSTRPITDERYMSLRFGPAPIIHGHADGGSIRLYGYGTSLLVDPGGYTYNQDMWRAFFKGRSAHNVVTVDGAAWNARSHTTLSKQIHTSTLTYAQIYQPGNPGVSHVRGVAFSRRLGYVIVDDRLAANVTRTFRQLWHLPADGKPLVRPTSFNTQRGRGNLQVRQLLGGSTSRVVMGQTSPVQGWVASSFGVKAAAPVVEVLKAGRNVRYLTLLSTHAGAPATTVSGLTLTADGYRVTVTIGGKSERVVVNSSGASITPLN